MSPFKHSIEMNRHRSASGPKAVLLSISIILAFNLVAIVSASVEPADQEQVLSDYNRESEFVSATNSSDFFNVTSEPSKLPANNLELESRNAKVGSPSEGFQNVNTVEPIAGSLRNSQAAQPIRKLIKSRYRLRSIKSGPQLVNYSQPLDSDQANGLRNKHSNLARALSSFSTPAGSADLNAHFISSNHLSRSAHRADASSLSTTLDDTGISPSHAGHSESLSDYTPPVQHQSYTPLTSNQRAYLPTAEARLRTMQTSQNLASLPTDMGAPHYAPSPTATYSDYYGSPASVDPHLSAGDQYDHYGSSVVPSMTNFSDIQFTAPYYSSAPPPPPEALPMPPYYGADISHYAPSGSTLGRSRWSWPWTDASASGNPMTSATFKKHFFHHHHQPAYYKEHDHHHHQHHEEHDLLMPKWEHGISIGEIACIAVAVVLGVIILGSPFFLLFLMLFNGGNLFSSTQMGLLAPASGQAAAAVTPASGRRRRSIESPKNGLDKEQLGRHLKALGAEGVGEFLFDRLSPFMDPDKLMRSFGQIMSVKDDIEKIIEKLGKHETNIGFEGHSLTDGLSGERKSLNEKGKIAEQNKHVEMRRKRRK